MSAGTSSTAAIVALAASGARSPGAMPTTPGSPTRLQVTRPKPPWAITSRYDGRSPWAIIRRAAWTALTCCSASEILRRATRPVWGPLRPPTQADPRRSRRSCRRDRANDRCVEVRTGHRGHLTRIDSATVSAVSSSLVGSYAIVATIARSATVNRGRCLRPRSSRPGRAILPTLASTVRRGAVCRRPCRDQALAFARVVASL